MRATEESHLYQQIAESIRRDILNGVLKPGERLPSVRQLREQWNCTPGTAQRAYAELAREGLVTSLPGRGTQVAGGISASRIQSESALRKAGLVHSSEAFLLETLTAGYALSEIQEALDLAMDRWRTLDSTPERPSRERFRFIGSHDMVINGLVRHYFGEIEPDIEMEVTFSGSTGGLNALAEGRADLCGCHLWDPLTGNYNLPFTQRLLPGKEVTVITLAHRCLGLITAPGNPLHLLSVAALSRPEVRFVNRQPGSGTRVWLDAELERLEISPKQVNGYRDERLTHSDVARAVAEGAADAGIGLENAAHAYSLNFFLLTKERYDLVMLRETAQRPSMQQFLGWLRGSEGKAFIGRFKGYDTSGTGVVQAG
jgi:putative molybdopterin biosynthesis protein